MSQNNKKGDYEVGYGKPPKSGQFKKGHKGHGPKGHGHKAQAKQPTLAELFAREAALIYPATIDGVPQKLPKLQIAVKAVMNKAMKGDLNAFKVVAMGVGYLPPDVTDQGPISSEELALLKEYFGDKSAAHETDEDAAPSDENKDDPGENDPTGDDQ